MYYLVYKCNNILKANKMEQNKFDWSKLSSIAFLWRKLPNLGILKLSNEERKKQKKDIITTLLKPGKIVLLNGYWGSGKTYRWKENIEPNLKNPVYISLFGMENIKELKDEIFNNYIYKIEEFKSFKYFFSFIFLILFVIAFFLIAIRVLIVTVPNINTELWFLFAFLILATICFSVYHWKSTLTYILNKYIGLNSSTIEINNLFPKGTVFCFDDLERLSINANIDSFLGYFKRLTNDYGYSILLISCYERCPKKTDGTLVSQGENINQIDFTAFYKEKVVCQEIMQRHEPILKAIIEQRTIQNTALYKYLIELNQNLQAIRTESKEYDEKSTRDIDLIKHNIRFFEKIIENVNNFYALPELSGIELPDDVKYDIIRFITLVTIDTTLNATTDRGSYNLESFSYLFNYHEKAKRLRNLILGNNFFYRDFRVIYDILTTGSYDSMEVEKNITKLNTLTSFEKKVELNHILKYRTHELRDIYNEATALIEHEEILFSSYKNMTRALGMYVLIGKNSSMLPLADTSKEYLKRNIRACIDKTQENLLDQLEKSGFGYHLNQQEIPADLSDLYKEIDSIIIQKHFNNLPQKKDFFDILEEKLLNSNDIFDIIAWNEEENFEYFKSLKENNYTQYIEIMERFMSYTPDIRDTFNQMAFNILNSGKNSYRELLEKLKTDLENFQKSSTDFYNEKSPNERYLDKITRDFNNQKSSS